MEEVAKENTPQNAPPPHTPTGVNDFDAITGGLFPGTVLLLIGESGAGHVEFALTSASHIIEATAFSKESYLGAYQGTTRLPGQVAFLSFTRSREEMLQEVGGAFPGYYPALLSDRLSFTDLSSAYFSDSLVPPEWSKTKRALLDGSSRPSDGVLATMARNLESTAKDALVVVDALSDLLVRSSIPREDVITLVKGLRRRAKDWKGLVYLLLTRHVTEPWIEEAIKDSVDCVLEFGWVQSPKKSSRTRAMWIAKSMPLLAYVLPERRGRFILDVQRENGLVTTQYERID